MMEKNTALERAAEALRQRGFSVRTFATAKEAADYLDGAIDGVSVGFGGSITLEEMDLWERLRAHNQVYSHMHGFPLGPEAAHAKVYITSVNGLAETGEIINIDGIGNRVASTLYGHEKVYLVVGRNKLAPTYEEALFRARNTAGPKNAQRKQVKTPCAAGGEHCYDCRSPERVCRALTVLWAPMSGMETEVVLIDQPLGY